MKEKLLQYIVCPDCGFKFSLKTREKKNSEIFSGALLCGKCGIEYPIVNSIPRIIKSNIDFIKIDTAESFSYEWRGFPKLTDKYRSQFLDWIYPVKESFFKGKIVLDAGCGKGRHVYWASRFGAKEVIGIDLGSTVEVAYNNTKHLSNAHIIQADIYNLPFNRVFDYIYSIGVVHHLPKPKQGFVKLTSRLKKGGAISVWVYGREGNDWIVNIVNPIRKTITSKLPLAAVKIISFILACILHPVVKFIYRPINRLKFDKLKKFLFYNDYLYSISDFGFQENYSIIFDHLLAPVAFYVRKYEFQDWFKSVNLKRINISWRNKNSWRGFAIYDDKSN